MKIKTSTYLRELAEAERHGYERGMREAEDRMWNRRRLDERNEAEEKFRGKVLRILEEHERKFAALCGEAGAEKPVSVEEYDGKCECGPVINCTVAE